MNKARKDPSDYVGEEGTKKQTAALMKRGKWGKAQHPRYERNIANSLTDRMIVFT